MNIFKSLLLLLGVCLSLFSCKSPSVKRDKNPTTIDNSKTSDAVDSKNIDSARKTAYMTDREKDMIKEINRIRSNPKGYIPVVEKYIAAQQAYKARVVSGKEYIDDEIKTAKELIKELNITPALSILQPHEGVYKAAKVHGQEGKKKGELDHQGKDDSWPWDRIKKYAQLSNGGENLVGGLSTVEEAVMVLLVDSGIESRGHRKALLAPEWKYVACYEVGTVGDMPFYWVQNFGN